MRLKEFKNKMRKRVFTWAEARVVAFNTNPGVLRLELHKWRRAGDVISLRRGVYLFAGTTPPVTEIAKSLYSPCYISMEYALNDYGLIPDVPFGVTLVTTKSTRKFNTPFGQFSYRKIKREAFLGYNPETLFAELEKSLVDYLYLNQHKLIADQHFWDEMRWQNLESVRFRKAFEFAKYFNSRKLDVLLGSLKEYAGTIKTHRAA